MAEMRDSSVLFSLNQLMSLERQRLREEEESQRARAEAEIAAKRAREQRAREEQEARLREEEARQRAEEARRRESEARIEAIRLGEVERIRIEAEQRQRIALMEQANDHERKLAALKEDKQKRRLTRILTIGGALMALVFTVGFGAYFGVIAPEAERAHQQELAEIAARDADLKRLRSEYEQALARSDKAAQDLAAAKDTVDRIRAQKAVDDARRAADEAGKRLGSGPVASVKKPKDPGCKCVDPNDPLCGCLN